MKKKSEKANQTNQRDGSPGFAVKPGEPSLWFVRSRVKQLLVKQ